MSVLINMEMPVSCRVCSFSQPDGVGWVCPVVTGRPIVDSRIKTRHPSCPLVDIPEHGRLIDADALNYTMLYKEDWMAGTGAEVPAVWKKDIDSAPTIIPAEEAKA